MDGKVILIEGIDGSGKTTLVRNLRDELTGSGIPVRVSRNALCPENPIAKIADELRRDPEAGLEETGLLFLASHLWDARNFRRPPSGTVHIQDSCWLRTLAFHTLKRTPFVPAYLGQAWRSFPGIDLAIFLTVDIEERRSRLEERERELPGSNDQGDREVVHNKSFAFGLDEQLRSLAAGMLDAKVIDTTGFSRDQVAREVFSMVKEILK